MKEYIDTKTLCEWLNINKNTALRWRKEEGLPHIKISANRVRYDRVEVEKWLEERNKNSL